MLMGEPPFAHTDRSQLFELIVGGNVRFAHSVSPRASSLVLGLLKVDPSQRLGNIQNGVEAIKQHPFFEGIDWAVVAQRGLTPPIKPSPTAYKFEPLPPVQLSSTSSEANDAFKDF